MDVTDDAEYGAAAVASLRTKLQQAHKRGACAIYQLEAHFELLGIVRQQLIGEHERAEAAETKLLQGGSVVFTGLSVPKQQLDEARAELATQGDELRAAQRDAAEQRALLKEVPHEADYSGEWNGERCVPNCLRCRAEKLAPAEAQEEGE